MNLDEIITALSRGHCSETRAREAGCELCLPRFAAIDAVRRMELELRRRRELGVDAKAMLGQPKQKTPRSAAFLAHLRARPCDCCGSSAQRSQAAHFGSDRGIAIKSSDFEACSLCPRCHAHWHQHGTLPDLTRAQSLLVQWRGAALALITFIRGSETSDIWEAVSKTIARELEAARHS